MQKCLSTARIELNAGSIDLSRLACPKHYLSLSIKGKFCTTELSYPLMHVIDRTYPIQVTALQIGKIKWCKIFPLCSLHKEKVLRRQAPLTGFHPNHVLWHKILGPRTCMKTFMYWRCSIPGLSITDQNGSGVCSR